MLILHKKLNRIYYYYWLRFIYKTICSQFFFPQPGFEPGTSRLSGTFIYLSIYLSISYLYLKSYCSLASNYLQEYASKYRKESDLQVIFPDATIQTVCPNIESNLKSQTDHDTFFMLVNRHAMPCCFFPHETIKRYASL